MTRILIENASTETGVTVRKNYGTATPSQAAGFPGSEVVDESPSTSWRSADTQDSNTALLMRLPKTRRVDGVTVLEDNMSRSGLWRATADDEYAIRPVWTTDGDTDYGETAETIPTSADITLMMRLWLEPQGLNQSTGVVRICAVGNAAGIRFELLLQAGSAGGGNWQLYAFVTNWGTSAFTGFAGIFPDGNHYDLAVRYLDSTKLFETMSSGTVVASTTAISGWADNGPEKLVLGRGISGLNIEKTKVVWQDVRYVGRALTDAEIAAYRAEVQAGTERDLSGAWHFLEGTGSSVADATGTSTMTLTGGTWSERVNPVPRWSTGVLEAREQWTYRQALRIKPGTSATSPSLGDAPRSITMSGLIQIDPEDSLVDSFAAWYGPSFANSEVGLNTTSDGKIQARSNRGPLVARNSDAAVNDGLVRRWRIVLDGRNNLLSFYVGVGSAAETQQGASVAVSDFGTLSTCLLGLGSSFTAESTALVSDVRVYSEIRLEADDDLTADVGTADHHLLAHVRCDGSIKDQVDQTRSYTVVAASYEEISQPATRTLAAADKRRTAAADDPYELYARRLNALPALPVEVTEIYVEFWDPDNSDGYVSAAVILVQDGFRCSRAWGASFGDILKPVKRSVDGMPYLERGHRADKYRFDVRNLTVDESTELRERIRRQPTALTVVVLDEHLDSWKVAQRSSAGLLKVARTFSDPSTPELVDVSLEIEDVRRPG